MKNILDFIIVGAQKAGTTSLAGHLGYSPQIYIPPEKEIPYFLDRSMLKWGWNWYLDTYFKNADPDRLWGTSTPQYMMHPECFKTIKMAMPNVKIIVTLRDPISRLISHFDMATRLGVEKRNLNTVIEEQINHIEELRKTPYPDHTGKYIVSGEYGRILKELFTHFDSSQVHVVFFDDLTRDIQSELDRVSDFLGICRFAAAEPDKVRMRGGSKKKVPFNHNKLVAALSSISRSFGLSTMIPSRAKAKIGRISSWLDEWNVDTRTKTVTSDLRPDLLRGLREHYARDAVILENIGIPAPWVKRWTSH